MKNKDKLNIEKNITKYGEIKILHKLKVLTLSSKYKKLLFHINIEKFKQVKLLVFSNELKNVFRFFFYFLGKYEKFFHGVNIRNAWTSQVIRFFKRTQKN